MHRIMKRLKWPVRIKARYMLGETENVCRVTERMRPQPFPAMLALSSTNTLSPPPLLSSRQYPNPRTSLRAQSPRSPPRISSTSCHSQLQTERGLEFDIGDSFFRHESATGRDLGVLAASLYKKSTGRLRVLDAMCGCGVRSLRYLAEADADFVLANDANDDYRSLIVGNLSSVRDKEGRWVVESNDANRVMTECYLRRDFFDLIDVDSFGSDSTFLRSAFNCLKLGGLLYITSTDGYSSGGHRPHQ